VMKVEDKVRMVRVQRILAHAQVDPPGINPEHPSPLSAPRCPALPRLSASGTPRVPAPSGRSSALRHERPDWPSHRSASTSPHLLAGLVNMMSARLNPDRAILHASALMSSAHLREGGQEQRSGRAAPPLPITLRWTSGAFSTIKGRTHSRQRRMRHTRVDAVAIFDSPAEGAPVQRRRARSSPHAHASLCTGEQSGRE
jgi:hypothetical protein